MLADLDVCICRSDAWRRRPTRRRSRKRRRARRSRCSTSGTTLRASNSRRARKTLCRPIPPSPHPPHPHPASLSLAGRPPRSQTSTPRKSGAKRQPPWKSRISPFFSTPDRFFMFGRRRGNGGATTRSRVAARSEKGRGARDSDVSTRGHARGNSRCGFTAWACQSSGREAEV